MRSLELIRFAYLIWLEIKVAVSSMSEEVDGVAASLLFCITPVGRQASSFVLRLWGGKVVVLLPVWRLVVLLPMWQQACRFLCDACVAARL